MGAVLNPGQRQIAAKDFLFFAQFSMVADRGAVTTQQSLADP
jgi:hypothetical protein